MKLSPFPFPSHPFTFRFIPDAPAVIQEEAIAATGCWAVASVEICDTIRCGSQQGVVAWEILGVRVYPVSKQRETDVAVGVCQVMNFQPFHLFADSIFGNQ